MTHDWIGGVYMRSSVRVYAGADSKLFWGPEKSIVADGGGVLKAYQTRGDQVVRNEWPAPHDTQKLF